MRTTVIHLGNGFASFVPHVLDQNATRNAIAVDAWFESGGHLYRGIGVMEWSTAALPVDSGITNSGA